MTDFVEVLTREGKKESRRDRWRSGDKLCCWCRHGPVPSRTYMLHGLQTRRARKQQQNMEREETSQSPAAGAAGAAGEGGGPWLKRRGLSFAISVKEGWQYIRAVFTGQVMKAKASNEKEASEADLQASKMQVEAADAAEDEKKRLGL